MPAEYPGRYGKTDNGVVTVTTVWADERVYYPVHAVPYTPARHFAKGKNYPGCSAPSWRSARTWPIWAREAGFAFRAVAADSAYGDQDGFRAELAEAGLPFVMALRPRRGTWGRDTDAHTPADAARALAWDGPDDPGDWQPVTRTFRDEHTGTWWAAEATLGRWGPDGVRRLVVATADPATLPDKVTLYLVTNLPRPGGPRDSRKPAPGSWRWPEITRIYGIRNWIEQSYKQVKDELGLGRFPGPLRRRDPPPPGAGQLRVQLLLGRLVPCTPSGTAPACGTAARTRPRREGGRAPPSPRQRRRGRGRCAQYAPRFPPGSRCSARGRHGPPPAPPPPQLQRP